MKLIVKIVVQFIRPVWSAMINALFLIVLVPVYLIDPKARRAYKSNRATWDSIRTVDELARWFRDVYKYKWDGSGGLLDHDNTALEFFIDFGDCDDMGLYACKKLRQMGYEAHRIALFEGIYGHFDCVYRLPGEKTWSIFNYGNPTTALTIADCVSGLIIAWNYKYNWDNWFLLD